MSDTGSRTGGEKPIVLHSLHQLARLVPDRNALSREEAKRQRTIRRHKRKLAEAQRLEERRRREAEAGERETREQSERVYQRDGRAIWIADACYFLSEHAIERFTERHQPGVRRAQAIRELAHLIFHEAKVLPHHPKGYVVSEWPDNRYSYLHIARHEPRWRIATVLVKDRPGGEDQTFTLHRSDRRNELLIRLSDQAVSDYRRKTRVKGSMPDVRRRLIATLQLGGRIESDKPPWLPRRRSASAYILFTDHHKSMAIPLLHDPRNDELMVGMRTLSRFNGPQERQPKNKRKPRPHSRDQIAELTG